MRYIFVILLCSLCCGVVTAQSYEQCIEQALAAAEQDSLERSEALFRQALKLSPTDYRNTLVFNNLGKIQERMYWQNTQDVGKANDALNSYTMALSMNPEAVPLLLSRALFNIRLEQYARAVMDLTTVLDVNPTHLEARNYRAHCYLELHRYDEARNDYNRVLEADPSNELARLGLAMISQQTYHLNDAIERMSQLIEGNSTRADYYSIRSSMYSENRQPELAVMDLDRALLLEPDNTNYLLARAYLHKEMGDKRRARSDFEQAVALGVPQASLRQELKECR